MTTAGATVHLLVPADDAEDAISSLLDQTDVLDWAYADGGQPRPAPVTQPYTEGDFLATDPHASYRFEFAGSPTLAPGEHITVHRPDMKARYRITARKAGQDRTYYSVLFICAEGHWDEGGTEPACETMSLAEALFYATTTRPG